jgi:hypothetical protein
MAQALRLTAPGALLRFDGIDEHLDEAPRRRAADAQGALVLGGGPREPRGRDGQCRRARRSRGIVGVEGPKGLLVEPREAQLLALHRRDLGDAACRHEPGLDREQLGELVHDLG